MKRTLRDGIAIVLFLATSACVTAPLPAQAKKPVTKTKSPSTITLSNRTISLNGGIASSMIQKAQGKLLEFDEKSSQPIWIRINSGGGSVEAGLVLIDTMQAINSPVYCVVESKAYSMAAIILTFCQRRYALRHATIMLHEASYGTAGEDPSNRSRLDFLTRYLDRLHVRIAERLQMPVKAYRARIRDAWWLIAPEAKKAGVVDEVVAHVDFVSPPMERTEEKTTVTTQETTQEVPSHLRKVSIPKRR